MSDVSSSGAIFTVDNRNNKSYSGILASNKEYSSYFENQELNLNRSELNLERSEYRKLQAFSDLGRGDKKSSKSSKKVSNGHRLKKRAQCSDSLSEGSSVFRLSESQRFGPSREQGIARRLSNKLKERNRGKGCTSSLKMSSLKNPHLEQITQPQVRLLFRC